MFRSRSRGMSEREEKEEIVMTSSMSSLSASSSPHLLSFSPFQAVCVFRASSKPSIRDPTPSL